MRPIDADAIRARHISVARYFKAFENGKEFTKLIGVLVKRIDEAPTLDYAPVRHAIWIRQDDTYTRFQCGECKSKSFDRRWVFCPLCGAKMDGGEKDGGIPRY